MADEVIEALSEEIDDTAEALALMSILDEERHDEILEGIEECRNQLEVLSNQTAAAVTTAESPLLAQIMAELGTIRAELASLKSSMDSMQSRLKPSSSESPENQPAAPMEPEEPKAEELTEEPVREEQPEAREPKARRRRIL